MPFGCGADAARFPVGLQPLRPPSAASCGPGCWRRRESPPHLRLASLINRRRGTQVREGVASCQLLRSVFIQRHHLLEDILWLRCSSSHMTLSLCVGIHSLKAFCSRSIIDEVRLLGCWVTPGGHMRACRRRRPPPPMVYVHAGSRTTTTIPRLLSLVSKGRVVRSALGW